MMARYIFTLNPKIEQSLMTALWLPLHWILFSYCSTSLTSGCKFFICSDTEEDQPAESSLQRLAGALKLEPVDSLDKCNLLTLFDPTAVCSCSPVSLTCLQCLCMSSYPLGNFVFCGCHTHWWPRDNTGYIQTIYLYLLFI